MPAAHASVLMKIFIWAWPELRRCSQNNALPRRKSCSIQAIPASHISLKGHPALLDVRPLAPGAMSLSNTAIRVTQPRSDQNMDQNSDFYQQEGQVPRLLTRVLAAIILAGGACFLLFAVMMFFFDARSRSDGGIGIVLFTFALGLGFVYIGRRLWRVRRARDHLLSPTASRITSYCIVPLGVLLICDGASRSNWDQVEAGTFAIVMAVAVYPGAANNRVNAKSLLRYEPGAWPRLIAS
jgi:hypothetical protein